MSILNSILSTQGLANVKKFHILQRNICASADKIYLMKKSVTKRRYIVLYLLIIISKENDDKERPSIHF